MPFSAQHQFTKEQHRTLALVAVFQAAQLVHIVATSGVTDLDKIGRQYTDTLIYAALNIRANTNPAQNSLLFFQSLDHLTVGLHSLERCFNPHYHPQHPQQRYPLPQKKPQHGKQTLAYAMRLLNLSAKIYKTPDFQHLISESQQKVLKQLPFFNHDFQHSSIISALAQTYSDTASTIKPRIMIKGSAQAFNSPHQVNYIRALLFTGLQAAHYWRELGGSPWQLIFSKRKIVKDIQYFSELQYKSKANIG